MRKNSQTRDQVLGSRFADFIQILTFTEAAGIKKFFYSEPNRYLDAPKHYAQFKCATPKIKTETYHIVYHDIRAFNLIAKNLGKRRIQSIFGTEPNSCKRFSYKHDIMPLIKDLKIQNHGRLTWKNHHKKSPSDHDYVIEYFSDHYSVGREKLNTIFADPKLLKKVLDYHSDFYSLRARRIIQKIITENRNDSFDEVIADV